MRHIRIPRQGLACAAVTLIAFTLTGQQPPSQTTAPRTQPGPAETLKPGEVPVFNTGTHLIVINVTVKDKSGKVAEGLTAKDFTVLEDGKIQTIDPKLFEFEKLAINPEPPPPLDLTEQLELPPAPKTTITAERPNEITYHDKRMMVFFFD